MGLWDRLAGATIHQACAALEAEREASRVAAEKQAALRQSHGLASVTGQQDAIRRLRAFVTLHSAQKGGTLGHILLTGPEGMGKRTLARALAVEYCGALVEADAKALQRTGDLMGILTNLGESDALIITSIERMPRVVLEFLVPALKDLQVDFVVDKGMFAKTINVPLKRFTCIGTTRSETQCPRELVETFHLVVPLQRYTREDLYHICQRVALQNGISMSAGVATMIASASDGTPHHVDLLVRRLVALGKAEVDEQDVTRLFSILDLGSAGATLASAAGEIGTLSGVDFERIITELLGRMGFRARMTKASGDGGIDIVATLDRHIVGGRYLIQCKRFAPENLVGSATVREFYGALTADRVAVKGVFITTSDFTAQAREFAEGLPIELIGGMQLRSLLLEHGLATTGASESGELFGEAK
jgi:Holliday junction resolvasome RuvABC ATP-dependent DNA helicase subunit